MSTSRSISSSKNSGTATQTAATIWIARLTTKNPDDDDDRVDPNLDEIKERIREQYPQVLAEARHGDMLEDATVAGYRSEGVFMISNTGDDFEVVRLEHGLDDYGSVNRQFQAITEFPLDYWQYEKMVVRNLDDPSSNRPASYWHSPTALVRIGDRVQTDATNVRSSNNNLYFEYNGSEYTINFVQDMNQLFGYYNGFVYCIDRTTATAEL